MRGVRHGRLAVWAAVVLLGGCTHEERLKPPRPEPQYVLPPNDPRFSTYPRFPEKTLNQFEKKSDDDVGPGGLPGRGMGRPGMGGAGMGGAGTGGAY